MPFRSIELAARTGLENPKGVAIFAVMLASICLTQSVVCTVAYLSKSRGSKKREIRSMTNLHLANHCGAKVTVSGPAGQEGELQQKLQRKRTSLNINHACPFAPREIHAIPNVRPLRGMCSDLV
ncbi:hypothetical protein [Collimonas antrihumi]|uniref:hypothetical protein n=1 Tax=Collimonas antrihumi TaxID=1940615 RepID=UPI001B8D7B14|nr:hypothetical protein [Collimonas antrihumi]